MKAFFWLLLRVAEGEREAETGVAGVCMPETSSFSFTEVVLPREAMLFISFVSRVSSKLQIDFVDA